MLLFALDRMRATFAWKVGDLDTESLHRTFPPSTMTLAGLLNHLARVEDEKVAVFFTGEPMQGGWRREDFEADEDWDWTSAAHHSADELYTRWRDAVDRRATVVARLLADGDPGQPTKYVTRSGKAINLRRILVDLHDEYARHTGHADLFREAIDGRVGEDPPQL